MACVKHVCWTVVCDRCSCRDDGGDFEPHYTSEKDAIDRCQDVSDWVLRDGVLMCPDCRERDDRMLQDDE